MKTKIIFLRKVNHIYQKTGEKNVKGDIYDVIGDSKLKEGEEWFKWKTHVVIKPPQNFCAFANKKERIILFDIDNKQYVNFEKTDLGLSTEFLEKILGRAIVGQLAKAIKKSTDEEKTNFDFVKTLIIGAVCAIGGYLIGIGGF